MSLVCWGDESGLPRRWIEMSLLPQDDEFDLLMRWGRLKATEMYPSLPCKPVIYIPHTYFIVKCWTNIPFLFFPDYTKFYMIIEYAMCVYALHKCFVCLYISIVYTYTIYAHCTCTFLCMYLCFSAPARVLDRTYYFTTLYIFAVYMNDLAPPKTVK